MLNLDDCEYVVVESEDGEQIVKITGDGINVSDGYRVRIKPVDAAQYRTPPTISEPCKYCLDNPMNGGSGLCHCTLGILTIT